MKKFNFSFNQAGKALTFLIIFGFMISDLITKSNSPKEISYLASSILFSACIVSLAILFKDNKD